MIVAGAVMVFDIQIGRKNLTRTPIAVEKGTTKTTAVATKTNAVLTAAALGRVVIRDHAVAKRPMCKYLYYICARNIETP